MTSPKANSVSIPLLPGDPTGVPVQLGPHACVIRYSNRMLYRLGLLQRKLAGRIDYSWTVSTVWAMLDAGPASGADPEDLTTHITPDNWPDFAARILEAYTRAGVGEASPEKKSTDRNGSKPKPSPA